MLTTIILIPCFENVPGCNLNWDAIGSAGTWVSGMFTLAAVAMPILVARCKEKRRVEAQLLDFIPDLHSLITQVRKHVEYMSHDLGSNVTYELPSLQIVVQFPSVAITSYNARLTAALRRCQMSLVRWNAEVGAVKIYGSLNASEADIGRNIVIRCGRELEGSARLVILEMQRFLPASLSKDMDYVPPAPRRRF